MARAAGDVVRINGLQELIRGLNGAEPAVWRALRAEFKTVGSWMATKAAANTSSDAAAAKTLGPTFKGKGDRLGAIVTLGGAGGPGKAYRAGAGQEFGSRDPGDQFKNPYVSVKSDGAMAGHYLGRALRANRDELEKRAIDAVEDFWGRLANDVNRPG
jgi:hypothetical protein